ncbi:MAG: hypothetical protein CNLJKLNK_00850 [Holosporales bacterium]
MKDKYLKRIKKQRKIFSLALSLSIINAPLHADISCDMLSSNSLVDDVSVEDSSWGMISLEDCKEVATEPTIACENGIETFSRNDVATFADYADLAYKLANNEESDLPSSVTKTVRIFKSDDSTRYGHYMGDNFGCIAIREDGKIIVSFKGTTSSQNAITDGFFSWRTYNGGRYHNGILNAYLSVQSALLKALEELAGERETTLANILKETYFTGHSLGGGMAIIAADQLRRAHYDLSGVVTFAAPKVMDAKTVAEYDQQLHAKTLAVEQKTDPVPLLNPLTWLSCQAGQVLTIPYQMGIIQHKLSGYKYVLNAFTQCSTITASSIFPLLSGGAKKIEFKFEKTDKHESVLYNAASWVGKTFLSPFRSRLR